MQASAAAVQQPVENRANETVDFYVKPLDKKLNFNNLISVASANSFEGLGNCKNRQTCKSLVCKYLSGGLAGATALTISAIAAYVVLTEGPHVSKMPQFFQDASTISKLIMNMAVIQLPFIAIKNTIPEALLTIPKGIWTTGKAVFLYGYRCGSQNGIDKTIASYKNAIVQNEKLHFHRLSEKLEKYKLVNIDKISEAEQEINILKKNIVSMKKIYLDALQEGEDKIDEIFIDLNRKIAEVESSLSKSKEEAMKVKKSSSPLKSIPLIGRFF